MLKTTLKIAALSAVSLTFLSACGASNLLNEINNALNADNSETRNNSSTFSGFLAVPEGQPEAVADRIASLKSVGRYVLDPTAPEQLFGFEPYRAPVTYSQVNDTFSLVKADDGFTMTVNGVKYPISDVSEAHGNETRYKGADGTSIWIVVDDPPNGRDIETYLTKVLDGTHAEVKGTFMSYNTDVNYYNTQPQSNYDIDHTAGYATIGVQTTPEVVANQTATATYTGSMMLDINTSGANVGFKNTYNGTLSMDVNFQDSMIEGVASYTTYNSKGLINAGKINFAPTPIIGNGFAGDFTFDSSMRRHMGLTNNPTGSYAGNFFGPDADDLAGIVQFNGITNRNDKVGRPGGNVIGIGGFRADRQ